MQKDQGSRLVLTGSGQKLTNKGGELQRELKLNNRSESWAPTSEVNKN